MRAKRGERPRGAQDLSPRAASFAAMAAPELATPTSLVLSPSAVERIRGLRGQCERPGGVLRLRIIAGGCSGMQYRIDFTEAPRSNDVVVEQEGGEVVVDRQPLTDLHGPQ